MRLIQRIRASYWFVPSVMSAGALAAAAVALQIDTRIGADVIERFPWLGAGTREGSRALLSTVAGSMITVAGVVFSITMVAVVHASSQFGPRLLLTFMRDRANQITLGTFVATFLYCIVVLRSLRGVGEATTGQLPDVAVLGGLLLCIGSLAAFIFFLHHAPESIHVSNVVARVGAELRKRVAEVYGRSEGQGGAAERAAGASGEPRWIPAGCSGYVQSIHPERLVELAREHAVRFEIRLEPGDWVFDEKPLFGVVGETRLDEDTLDAAREAFAIGAHRARAAEVPFNTDQLVEIAGRALSPGINDPFTAMSCMDWLVASLAAMADRAPPSSLHRDREGVPRVRVVTRDFERQASAVFDRTRPYVAPDLNATLHVLGLMRDLARVAGDEAAEVVGQHARALAAEASGHVVLDRDRDAIEGRLHEVLAA